MKHYQEALITLVGFFNTIDMYSLGLGFEYPQTLAPAPVQCTCCHLLQTLDRLNDSDK